MKYILVIDHIATGGAERILVDYYHYLEKHGHEVYVFVLSGHEGESKWTEGLKVTYGSIGDENNLLKKTFQQFSLYFKLKKLVRKINPDVIFSFLEKSNLLTILTTTNATKVVSVHNVLSIQYTKIKSDKVRSLVYVIIRWMYNHCPNVIAVSKQVKDDLIDSFKIKPVNIKVVNNYVDRNYIKEKVQESIDNFTFQSDKKYIMNIGRFSEQKAQWKLIKAFSIYRQQTNEKVELVLMGQGEYTDQLKILSEKLHISEYTHFLPFSTNPYKYMAHAYLFALSSIYEGFPIVLAEVSSLRIPFIGTEKALPEEMFSNTNFWNQCIFKSSTLEKDFSTEIHQDEKELAMLLKKGIEDTEFRNKLLENTKQWERNNSKDIQFEYYDSFCNKK